MKFPLFRRRARSDTISTLYGTIVAQARAPAFYQNYGVPDTVAGRLEMIMLHAVLLLGRLEGEAAPIVSTRLLAPAPNPFFSATTIGLELAQAGAVSLGVYDVAGRQIRTLVAGERSAGRYQITWDGRNDAGARVASGMYFVRLTSEGRTSTRPLLLAR